MKTIFAAAVLMLVTSSASRADWAADLTIDRQIGLFGRPWYIQPSLRSWDMLRERSGVRTGVQSLDRQVEKAFVSPAGFYQQLTAPAPTPVVRRPAAPVAQEPIAPDPPAPPPPPPGPNDPQNPNNDPNFQQG